MTLITTPTGRLVYGHPSVKVQKKNQKREPVYDKNGQPVMIHAFGVAFAKADFNAHIWPTMWNEASALYGGQQPPPRFAYKYKDGDGPDSEGKPYSARAGYAGCFVVHFETQFDLIAYRQNPAGGGWMQITEKDYKTGDYIAVSVDISGHKPTDPTHTPGLYTNPQGILLIGVGDAIINAPSADQMFGGQQFALPPGAVAPGAMPTGPTGNVGAPGIAPPPAPGGYQQPAMPPAPGGYQQPAMPPAPGGYQPAPDFVQNAVGGYPAAPGGYQQAPAPGGYPAAPGAMPPAPGQFPTGR